MTVRELYYTCNNVNNFADVTLYGLTGENLSENWEVRQTQFDAEVLWFRVIGNKMEVGTA